MITAKQINKAIIAETGIDAKIFCDRKYGVCHFYSDDPAVKINSESVYIMRLSDNTIEEWVEKFKSLNDL